MFLMCWVFSAISALMYSEALVVKTTAAAETIGGIVSYVDAAPGPLEHMIEDTEAIVFVKEMSVYMKVTTPLISAFVSWRCFCSWTDWDVSKSFIVPGFMLRLALTLLCTVVPWFKYPLTDPEAARLWPVISAIKANLPAI